MKWLKIVGAMLIAAAAFAGDCCRLAWAEEKNPPSKPVSLKDLLPRTDPLSPSEALKAFQVAPGFRVELVAAEPNVVDPIALAFDENGRLFVAEDIDYPIPPKPSEKALGRIRLLEDKNNDGLYETSSIFADDLSMPSGLVPYRGGLFVAAPPRIWYLKDTQGSGRADVRRVVYDGFGTSSAEDIMNNLKWGLDNWIYGASSYNGGDIRHEQTPVGSVRGRDFRFNPVDEQFEPLAGSGDFGNTFDDWGNRFVSNAGMLLYHNVLPGNYLARNPHLQVQAVNSRSAQAKKKMAVISPPEAWRVVRKKFWNRFVDTSNDLRASRFSETELAEGGLVTGGAGAEIYRGDAFADVFHGNSFTAEPSGNVVIRLELKPNGTTFDAVSVDESREFLASTDPWFRPVNVANGPDGCLYVLDMSRELIEDPSAIPPDILKHYDVTRGRDRGRIYRVVPEKFVRPAKPKLGSATTEELVALLQSRSGWTRETAQRLLVERQNRAAIEPLQTIVRQAKFPQARLHALWTLRGLHALDEVTLLVALGDVHVEVRRHAVRLSEPLLANAAQIRAAVLGLADDEAPPVRLQVAFSLGTIADEPATHEALAKILVRDSDDYWIRTAVMSSVGSRPGTIFAAVLKHWETLLPKQRESILIPLAEQVALRAKDDDLKNILLGIGKPPLSADPSLTDGLLLTLAETMRRGKKSLTEVLAAKAFSTARERFEQSLSAAAQTANDPSAELTERQRAIRLLQFANWDTAVSVLPALMNVSQPPEIQLAALRSLGSRPEEQVATALVQRWSTVSPQFHREMLEVLLRQPQRYPHLLAALESRAILPTALDPVQRTLFVQGIAPNLRDRAEQVLAAAAVSSRQAVLEKYQAALLLPGDAQRGRDIFARHCATCHKLGEVGQAVGPDLASVRAKPKDAILLSILDPSREVGAGFVNYVAVMDDGRAITGLLAQETTHAITLRRAQGAEDLLPRADIEELRSTGKSLMPEGMEQQIDVAQMADLLEFLTGAK